MDQLSSLIGHNLMNIRKQRKLSLEKLAEITSVSKAMLGQIERGGSSPTVATLWKIATGLHISFTELMTEKKSDVELVRIAAIEPIVDEQDGLKAYPLFPFEQSRKFEIFSIDLAPGCSHTSPPHDEKTEEFLIVTQGIVSLTVGKSTYQLTLGDALRYHSNQEHTYANLTNSTATFQNIIYYGS